MSDKTCGFCCKSGEFQCEIPVLYPLGRNRLISVDRCMVPELQSLWLRGIETGGCCCGHFETDAFIQVMPEHVDAMLELGYEPIPPVEIDGELMGEDAFKPKTEFEFHEYGDFKSVLEQRYEKLESVARGLYDHAWALHVTTMRKGKFDDKAREADYQLERFRDKLRGCGVNIDD